jgi:hypothetical protein
MAKRYYCRKRQEMGLPQPRGELSFLLDNVPDGVLRSGKGLQVVALAPERAAYFQSLGPAVSEASRLGNIPNPGNINWPHGMVGFCVEGGKVIDTTTAAQRGEVKCRRCDNDFLSPDVKQIHVCQNCRYRDKIGMAKARNSLFTTPWRKKGQEGFDHLPRPLARFNKGIGSSTPLARTDKENVKDFGEIPESLFDDPTEEGQ